MRTVLDTNVLVSAARTPAGTCDQILQAALRADFAVCTTRKILDEYDDVLPRPHLGLLPESIAEILTFFHDAPDRFPDTAWPSGLLDPDDEIFLAAAIGAKADYLVTGNLRHFPPHLRRGINVVAPVQFLRILGTP